jgi:hypothetical protein
MIIKSLNDEELKEIVSLNRNVGEFYQKHYYNCEDMEKLMFKNELSYDGWGCRYYEDEHFEHVHDQENSKYCLCHSPCNDDGCDACTTFDFHIFIQCNSCHEWESFDDLVTKFN